MTLRYREAGAGRALVMLPGLGHAASLYKYQLEGLCDEFRVIALDPRGHGESDKPEGGLQLPHIGQGPRRIPQLVAPPH